MSTGSLSTSIDYLNGMRQEHAKLLHDELDINSIEDLLHLFPYRYVDRTKYLKINQLYSTKAEVQIIGQIIDIKRIKQKHGERLEASFSDNTGELSLIWFRVPKWLPTSLKLNTPYVIFGKCNSYKSSLQMVHPEMELLNQHQNKQKIAIHAIYPSTEKLSKANITSRKLSQYIHTAIQNIQGRFVETLPKIIIDNLKLISKDNALRQIHFPNTQEWLACAEFRLKFEELFFVQLQLLQRNIHHKENIKGFFFKKIGMLFHDFYENHLPFALTNAQKRVLKEIRRDLGSHVQMNRLLQGDVGSGKTIVALLTSLMAIDNGYQVSILAPTEILADQHFQSFSELLKNLPIQIELLTGSTSATKRKSLFEELKKGKINILVGTHAIIEDKVIFAKLGIAVIDEQHRFGVAQRSKLWLKNNGIPPHILVMTATPIPRTLAMSLYGDLDISTIDELPPGRKAIKTLHKYDSNRLQIIKFIKNQIAKGRQIYIVYPLIEESDKLSYKDLMDGYASIERDFPKPNYQISVVHGQMKSADKEYEMRRFSEGKTHIMVATTVIEVGVNVPNASVMVIESAERFGLSQLHQLRGRIGRGSEQSYCLLMTDYKLSREARIRIETMVNTNDGFRVAEIDLQLRGPGDLMGTQQSGVLSLKIADISKDATLLKMARQYASQLLKSDPHLNLEVHQHTKKALEQLIRYKSLWQLIS